jgi:hypothetical protein
MGIVRTPKISDYWRKSGPLSNPYIHNIMTYSRYKIISKFLHFVDNSTENQTKDKLFKIRPLLNIFTDIWYQYYVPRENIVIDETIIPFKGRSKIKQYNPKKPHRFGIKAFALADSITGYVVKWRIYSGKEEDNAYSLSSLILDLLKGFEGQGFNLYCDNYFTTITMMKHLESMDISYTGTVRKNRKHLPVLQEPLKFTEENPCIVRRCDNIVFTLWKDKREVFMLSNKHPHSLVQKDRVKRGGYQQIYYRPLCIERYNEFMHGVDLANQLAATYRFKHKSLKWYKSIFYYLLDVTITNCYISYKDMMKRKSMKFLPNEDFRLTLVEHFLKELNSEFSSEAFVNPQKYINKRLKERHFLEIIPNKKRRDCVYCSNRKVRQIKSKYQCKFCKLAFCPAECFERYHTLKNFKEK